MAVPRAMARPLGPLMFSLPVGGGGAGKEKTMLFDDETENAPSTSSSQPREWALVELQGEVQAPEGAGPEDSFTAGRLVLKVRGIEGERGRRRGKGEGGVFGCRWCPSRSVSKKRRAKKLNFNLSKLQKPQHSPTAASSSSWATTCSKARSSTSRSRLRS